MERLKSFNVDFNWVGKTYSPASAFVQADAALLAQWYQEMGCNNFWTFAISYNGCAWYNSDHAPKAQGLCGNFTRDCVREGHKRGCPCSPTTALAPIRWWKPGTRNGPGGIPRI